MNGTVPASQQTGTKLVDDFLRRELRVGDPRSAGEVITALRRLYAADATRIDQEAAGFAPTCPGATLEPERCIAPSTTSLVEAQRADSALEADFAALIETPANRLRRAELAGWRSALQAEWVTAQETAHRAQDPAERERSFYAIRKLSEFARVARLVAVAYPNPEIVYPYRRLAWSLDGCGNVLRVLMGEALYRAGLAEGGLLVPMPLSQARDCRDGLILAVRHLTGAMAEDADWPDGLVSYRALRLALENDRRTDLLVYLREDSLAPILDRLVAEASRPSPGALRELAATSLVDLTRLTELVAVATRPEVAGAQQAIPQSPALSSFVENLRLLLRFFGLGVDGAIQGPMHARHGARLIVLAMPVSLAALGPNDQDFEARRQLRELAAWRHAFAVGAETGLGPPRDRTGNPIMSQEAWQIQVDQSVYATDRAIDYFAQGQERNDPPEQRATVYANAVDSLLDPWAPNPTGTPEEVLRHRLQAIGLVDRAAPPAPSCDIALELGRSTLTWNAMTRALSPR